MAPASPLSPIFLSASRRFPSIPMLTEEFLIIAVGFKTRPPEFFAPASAWRTARLPEQLPRCRRPRGSDHLDQPAERSHWRARRQASTRNLRAVASKSRGSENFIDPPIKSCISLAGPARRRSTAPKPARGPAARIPSHPLRAFALSAASGFGPIGRLVVTATNAASNHATAVPVNRSQRTVPDRNAWLRGGSRG